MASFFDDLFNAPATTDPLSAFLNSYNFSADGNNGAIEKKVSDSTVIKTDVGDLTENKVSDLKLLAQPIVTSQSEQSSRECLFPLDTFSQSNCNTVSFHDVTINVEHVAGNAGNCVMQERHNCLHTVDNGATSPLNDLSATSLESEHDLINADGSVEVQEQSPDLNIAISNVVCSFTTRCHLNLKMIAMQGAHVIYKRQNNVSNNG